MREGANRVRRQSCKNQSFSKLVKASVNAVLVCLGASVQAAPSDLEITMAIEGEIRRDDVVPFSRVDVATEDGIVTLTGSVSDLASKGRAEDISSRVKGVRSVINRIAVNVPDRPRESITEDVRAAFKLYGAVDNYETDVYVSPGGAITLSGTVDSWAERAFAERIATTVDGVSAVNNRLEVDESRVFRAEEEIRDDIETRLRWDVRVDDSLISVLARDGGRVLLSGVVGSLAEKNLAERLAWVEGVTEVDAAGLDVERWARDDDLRVGKYDARTDEEVRGALLRTFAYDPRVPSVGVEVIVRSGAVWLRGVVADLLAIDAAERDAYNTVGVDRVINNLKVRPQIASTAAVTETVTRALERFDGLEQDRIDVSVEDARVVVTGNVDSMLEYWQIDETVQAVDGVEAFANRVTVNGEEPLFTRDSYDHYPRQSSTTSRAIGLLKSDREIHRDLESELFWSPYVDSDDVNFDVEDGVVELLGTVDSPMERRAARDNAFEAGAIAVRDELVLAARNE